MYLGYNSMLLRVQIFSKHYNIHVHGKFWPFKETGEWRVTWFKLCYIQVLGEGNSSDEASVALLVGSQVAYLSFSCAKTVDGVYRDPSSCSLYYRWDDVNTTFKVWLTIQFKEWTLPLLCWCHTANHLNQGCRNPRCQVAVMNTFFMWAPNIFRSTVTDLLHVTLLAPRFLENLCTPDVICYSLMADFHFTDVHNKQWNPKY
jgi:hypothetical protein